MGRLKANACKFRKRYTLLSQYPKADPFDHVDNPVLDLTGVLFGTMNGQHVHGTAKHARCDRVPANLTAGRCTHWHLKP
jgi:hypothetical protein